MLWVIIIVAVLVILCWFGANGSYTNDDSYARAFTQVVCFILAWMLIFVEAILCFLWLVL